MPKFFRFRERVWRSSSMKADSKSWPGVGSWLTKPMYISSRWLISSSKVFVILDYFLSHALLRPLTTCLFKRAKRSQNNTRKDKESRISPQGNLKNLSNALFYKRLSRMIINKNTWLQTKIKLFIELANNSFFLLV